MNTVIETQRLILRPWTISEADQLHSILSDAETMSFWPKPFTLDESTDWIKNSLAHFKSHGYGRMAVILKESGIVIGDCGYKLAMIDGHEEVDLGYIIFKDFWGKGYALEAAKALFDYGKNQLGFKRIVANMEVTHAQSKAIAEKLGMKIEKTFINVRNRNKETYLLAWNQEK